MNFPSGSRARVGGPLLFLLFLTGCPTFAPRPGGSPSSTTQSAPVGLQYPTANLVYTLGVAISPEVPTAIGTDLSYSISPALPAGLILNTLDGSLSGTPSALASSGSYVVTATNSAGSSTTVLTITVNDVAPGSLTFSTPNPVYVVGTAISANHPSNTGGTIVAYAVTPDLPPGLNLDPFTGIITGTPTTPSVTASYAITGINTGGFASNVLQITVNDIPPSILNYQTAKATYVVQTPIQANSPSNHGGKITSYSVNPPLPPGLTLNSITGILSGTPMSPTAEAIYTVTGSNSGGSTSQPLDITVNDIAPTNLTYAQNNAVYTALTNCTNAPSNQGGTIASYTISPGLPQGLSLNSTTGVISGTPNAASSQTPYWVTGSNSVGSTQVELYITVNALSIVYLQNPAVYTAGTAITKDTVTNASQLQGWAGSLTYSVSPTLPAGLLFEGNSGTISGTPSAPMGKFNYTVNASNTAGLIAQTSLTITVNDAAPLSVSYTSPVTYSYNQAISPNNPTYTGGAPTSYSGTLPPGLTVDPSTGAIGGIPTAGGINQTYSITASNVSGSVTANITITVPAVHGAPDSSFNGMGKVTLGPGVQLAYPQRVALQTDGKIVYADSISVGRVTSNGSIDTTMFSAPVDSAYSASLQSTGKIIVAGGHYTNGDGSGFLERYLTNGTVDTTFGGAGNGAVVVSNDGPLLTPVVQPDDKTIAVSWGGSVYRFTSQGSSDSSWGTNGKVSFSYHAQTVELSKNTGQVLAAGSYWDGPKDQYELTVTLLTSSGSPDIGFGQNGSFTYSASAGENGVAQFESDGKVLLGGSLESVPNHHGILLRINADGTIDSAFGTSGVVLLPSDVVAISQQTDGKIVVFTSGGPTRLNPDGSADSSYLSYQGVQSAAFGFLQPDGNAVSGGFVNGSGSVWRFFQ